MAGPAPDSDASDDWMPAFHDWGGVIDVDLSMGQDQGPHDHSEGKTLS